MYQRVNSNNKFQLKLVSSILLMTILFLSSPFVNAASKKQVVLVSPGILPLNNTGVSPSPSIKNSIHDYKLNIAAQSAVVVEAGRGMRLYLKNAEDKSQIPVASKIMTAIIALDTIPLDSKITVSKVAAGQDDAYVLSLNNGEKYTLEYLLYGMILKDNNAAAIAISEQVSGVEEEFVKLMNSKAISYQMTSTKFTNATGKLNKNQYTTASDVARLVRFAMTSPGFENILKTKDIPFFLSTNKSKHLINNLSKAWDFVENTTGAFQSNSGDQSSFITSSSSGGINFITVACTTTKNKIIDDLATISSSIFSDYEFSALVKENQIFPKTITIGTDRINLLFKQRIDYVHPKNSEFVASTVYEENAIIEYPILATKSVAKVTFELSDGTKITADLYPDRTVWGELSVFQKLKSIYEANSDIGILVLISLSLLVLLCLYHLIRLIILLFSKIFSRNRNSNIDK